MPDPDATQPSPQPAEDLERLIAGLDPEFSSAARDGFMRDNWRAIRAALTQYQQEGLFSDRDIERLTRFGLAEDQLIELQKQLDAALARERDLREALREWHQALLEVREAQKHIGANTPTSSPLGVAAGRAFMRLGNAEYQLETLAQALLAQPAAGGGERAMKCFKCDKPSTHYACWKGMTDSVPACNDHGVQFVKLSEAFEDTEQGRAMAETLSRRIRHAAPWPGNEHG